MADIGTVIDTQDGQRCVRVVDAVQQAIRSAACAKDASEFAPHRLSNATRRPGQVAEREFDDRGMARSLGKGSADSVAWPGGLPTCLQKWRLSGSMYG